GGKDYRDQQFEGGAVVQLGGLERVVISQSAEELVTLGFVHYLLMVPLTRTRLLPTAVGASRCCAWRAVISFSITFFNAISRPMNRKAPGGRMTKSTSL